METEAYRRILDPETHIQPETEVKTEDSPEHENMDRNDDCRTRKHQLESTLLENKDVSQNPASFHYDCKQDLDIEPEETIHSTHLLKIHTEEIILSGLGFKNQFEQRQVPGKDIMAQQGEKQEDPETPVIKDEQEEICISQADTINPQSTPVPVKSEDDEEKPQTSQPHQGPTEQMKTGADGEDCAARNSDLERDLQPESEDSSEPDTEDSDDWRENTEHHSGLKSVRKNKRQNNGKESHSCSACSESFESKAELTTHTRIHAKEKNLTCSVCGKIFNHKGNLTTHMLIHTGDKPFSCSFCNKRFNQKGHLSTHMLLHTGDKPFSCPVCDKRFNQRGHLSSHVLVHTEDRPFSCSDCGKRFKRWFNLKLHIEQHKEQASELPSDRTEAKRDAESGSEEEDCGGQNLATFEQKLLSCSICSKRFKKRGHLTTHMYIHTGEKPFSCSVCSKSFRQKGHLTIHMLLHTGEKPFSCSFCSKTFNTDGSLKRHMMGHTGEKPLCCSQCGERFSWSYQLKKHECVETQA
ncbi:gastrula zinc finger protein xFG20-1-like isoform X2 [Xyrichtys novacula]|uniref:Gastrula zinc finger protein xFG20-1-like isoform X2 n=1 Tax=Xyrichtys novacula TaxID=13765 RepID=A0AAV1GWZ9_XYRNO|nr:gastrula zinc finger protein xFG20-1-like isoform X2 [Xyrichtys novacula]